MSIESKRRSLLFALAVSAVAFALNQLGSQLVPSKPPTLNTARPGDVPCSASQREAAVTTIERWLEQALRDSSDPWLTALGMRALGPQFKLQGKPIVEQLLTQLRNQDDTTEAGNVLRLFAEDGRVTSSARPLVAILLESGATLDALVRDGDPELTVEELARSLVRDSELARTDAAWASFSWDIDALALAQSRELEPERAREKVELFAAAGFAKLERESRIFDHWLGQGKAALPSALEELSRARAERRGVYQLEGGGLHLAQALIRAAAVATEPTLLAASRQLQGKLLTRYRLEQAAFERELETRPKSVATLLVTADYSGRMLELLGLFELLETTPSPAHSERRGAVASLACDVVQAVERLLLQAPSYSELKLQSGDELRALAASASALRGLRLAQRLSKKEQAQASAEETRPNGQ